ncbi:Na+/H+ antiporter [Archaeoglobales archaeon]|nr:MAG: Na+/H+ antiporter [Archaeoglobales archaeon]
MELLEEIIVLLLISCAVGVLVKYIRFPYTIALVLVGLFVGLTKLLPEIKLTEELVFFLILPPLLFEGAINTELENFKNNFKPILALATLGVLICVVGIGYLINYLLGIPLLLAFLFGAMITPTDPVSVLATFKTLGVPKKLSTIVEGESILNDGTGVVIFGIILEMIRIGKANVIAGIANFFLVCVGGVIIGLILGYAAYKILGYIDDHLIEVTITLILAFSSFIIAESFHVSGVIAVVAAGLIIGNYGKVFSMSPSTRISLITFWGFVVFMINSLVFILIGMDIHLDKLLNYWNAILIAIPVVLFSRILAVYPILNVFNLFEKSGKIPLLWQHVIFWGGLHGTIPVALALSLDIVNRDVIASMVFGVVLFSLVVQGISLEFIVKRKFAKDEKKLKYEEVLGRMIAAKAAKQEVEKMVLEGEIQEALANRVISDLDSIIQQLSKDYTKLMEDEELARDIWVKVWKRVLIAQKSAVIDSSVKGLISEHVSDKLIREIDDELSKLQNDM